MYQTEYRTVVLGALLGLHLDVDTHGMWWIHKGDETLPATSQQVHNWEAILHTSRLRFEEAVIAYASAEATARTRPLFTLLKGRGTEEGEL